MELIYELRNIMKLDQKKIKDTLKEVDKRKTPIMALNSKLAGIYDRM